MANRVVADAWLGFRISKPGYDVLTAADQNLLFRDTWRLLRVAKRASVWIPAANGQNNVNSQSYTIPHNVEISPGTVLMGFAGNVNYGYSYGAGYQNLGGSGNLFTPTSFYYRLVADSYNVTVEHYIGNRSGFAGEEVRFVIMDY